MLNKLFLDKGFINIISFIYFSPFSFSSQSFFFVVVYSFSYLGLPRDPVTWQSTEWVGIHQFDGETENGFTGHVILSFYYLF